MAEAARVLEFPDDYIHGSAAPAGTRYAEPAPRPVETTMQDEWIRQRERARAAAAVKNAPAVSLFAVFGTVFAGFLMVFVVLAQITYNEIAAEAVRLNSQFAALSEQQRRLEITFESVIDMKEVERYARDVLGMSRPDADQVAIVYSVPRDRVEILRGEGDSLREFGSFISSLLEYLRRR
jgi:cell division protein FtsL